MEKNWLIRTYQKQILGPVAKDKIVSFVEKGALGDSDEICSGNGFWFQVREKDLINKFVLNSETQSFNPISETKDILTANLKSVVSKEEETALESRMISEDELETRTIALPSFNDLEYPRNSELKVEVTIERQFSVDNTNNNIVPTKSPVVPQAEDLEYPTSSDAAEVVKNSDLEIGISNKHFKLPASADLEYPDIMSPIEKVKQASGGDISDQVAKKLKKAIEKYDTPLDVPTGNDIKYPESSDLSYPEISTAASVEKQQTGELQKSGFIKNTGAQIIDKKTLMTSNDKERTAPISMVKNISSNTKNTNEKIVVEKSSPEKGAQTVLNNSTNVFAKSKESSSNLFFYLVLIAVLTIVIFGILHYKNILLVQADFIFKSPKDEYVKRL